MYIQNVEELIENAEYPSDYKHDIGNILNAFELDELHKALTEWVKNASLLECQYMGKLCEMIRVFKEEEAEEVEE